MAATVDVALPPTPRREPGKLGVYVAHLPRNVRNKLHQGVKAWGETVASSRRPRSLASLIPNW